MMSIGVGRLALIFHTLRCVADGLECFGRAWIAVFSERLHCGRFTKTIDSIVLLAIALHHMEQLFARISVKAFSRRHCSGSTLSFALECKPETCDKKRVLFHRNKLFDGRTMQMDQQHFSLFW